MYAYISSEEPFAVDISEIPVTPAKWFRYRTDAEGAVITEYLGDLEEIRIPDEIKGKRVYKIGRGAFEKNSFITRAALPESVYALEEDCFYGALRLTEIYMPRVCEIKGGAFRSCINLTGADIPSVSVIGKEAFYNCVNLTSVNMPNVTEIGKDAFNSCLNLLSADIPKVREIGEWAFLLCEKLESVNMPNVVNIDRWAFENCTDLEEVALPDRLKHIDSTYGGAFTGCGKISVTHRGRTYGYREIDELYRAVNGEESDLAEE